MNSCCVFLGPSYQSENHNGKCQIFPPAALGSVYQAVIAGYRVIGIVDGYFGNVPSVWHKEILFALSRGVRVFGSSSMGALRAAELCAYGMQGVGTVYSLYKRKALTDDDEVCVAHGPAETGYALFSYPLVNIRLTLRRMRHRRIIDERGEQLVLEEMKRLHFSTRTAESLEYACRAFELPNNESLMDEFRTCYIDAKERDARRLVSVIDTVSKRLGQLGPHSPSFVFPKTSHWVKQFEAEIAELPALGTDPAQNELMWQPTQPVRGMQ